MGNSLTSNTWFDASGNVIKSYPAGSKLFVKVKYDSLGPQTVEYSGYCADTSYADESKMRFTVCLRPSAKRGVKRGTGFQPVMAQFQRLEAAATQKRECFGIHISRAKAQQS